MLTCNERPKREDIILKNKKKYTVVYFASFKTNNSMHDRTTRFTNEKPNVCFFDWLENNRKEIEQLKNTSATIVNCNIFKYEKI